MEKYIKNNSKLKQLFIKNNSKGITLISLVITIIILLILAGISISALTGSGLFEKAKLAKNRTQEAQDLENQMLQEYENQINQLGGASSVDNTEKVEFINVDTQNTNPAGAIPSGAKTIETDATKGIVIEDSKNNQWTWVEVPKTEVFKTATGADQYEAIKTDLINYATDYRQSGYIDEYYNGCGIEAKEGKTAEQVYEEMYEKMLSSVYTYGGFWISTYEMGIKGSDEDISLGRTTHTDITESSPEAVSQADHIPYNYITCSEAEKLASKMTTDSTKTSSLLFGIQWDLVCKYLELNGDWDTTTHTASYYIKENSLSWGNYTDSTLEITSSNAKKYDNFSGTWIELTGEKPEGSDILLTTGASEDTNKMNINDFAGNVSKWTLESFTSTTRGGHFDTVSFHQASNRNSSGPSAYNDCIGANVTLY